MGDSRFTTTHHRHFGALGRMATNGCINGAMAGKLSRRGSAVRCFHTIEVVAGMADGPAIGEEG